jgi:cell division protein FtsB
LDFQLMIATYIENVQQWLYRSRRKLATAAVCVVASVVAYHAVFGPNGMVVYEKKKTEYRQLDRDNAAMQQENDRLKKQIQALKSDPATIEKEAREQLRYTRPGEMVYVLPEQNKPPAQPPATATAQVQSAQ